MIARTIRWSRHNLFGKPFDTVLSIIVIPGVLWLVYQTVDWALTTAKWDVIPQSLRVLMIGIFPADQAWRAWTAVSIIGAILGAALGCIFTFRRRHVVFLLLTLFIVLLVTGPGEWATAPFIVLAMGGFAAGWLLTSYVPRARHVLLPAASTGFIAVFAVMTPPGVGLWGGLLLSILLTLVTSVLSLPIGIVLALGRRSRLSSVRVLCTAYIEVMRSVPLILVVYWIWILMPVLTPQWDLADVARGMIGFTIFYSAYVAEYMRSGLQAVPKGQTEAARSLGMSELDINLSIVLPQAFRVVLPPLVGNVLDIFNTAPLVFIIGLTDFLRAGQMILANPENSDRIYEVYSFLFMTYFIIGSLITFVARKLESHLSRGSR
ncbi:amino acid ABC transporter permease [Chelatococcus asaccharovorans]|uniref:amino acid ABC transporter permease n=1 Tax=Chelatococcus asaccharovorans TaxID=28210 RepID=UPI00224C6F03|nr:amino acid ABC transporter permease [Chelatococcus asaccharovorans]CAH1653040.1 General L-amino acid transport system permease protein [Chelatococcus asaccharovorans]CAH1686163.1 General L-amino acid transport system permease protein [Chelatococcus asaccharovorans]